MAPPHRPAPGLAWFVQNDLFRAGCVGIASLAIKLTADAALLKVDAGFFQTMMFDLERPP